MKNTVPEFDMRQGIFVHEQPMFEHCVVDDDIMVMNVPAGEVCQDHRPLDDSADGNWGDQRISQIELRERRGVLILHKK